MTSETETKAECGCCGANIEDANGDPLPDVTWFFVGEYSTPAQAEADQAYIVVSVEDFRKLDDITPRDGDADEVIAAHETIFVCKDCRRPFLMIAHVLFHHFRDCPEQLLALIKPPPHAQKPH